MRDYDLHWCIRSDFCLICGEFVNCVNESFLLLLNSFGHPIRPADYWDFFLAPKDGFGEITCVKVEIFHTCLAKNNIIITVVA